MNFEVYRIRIIFGDVTEINQAAEDSYVHLADIYLKIVQQNIEEICENISSKVVETPQLFPDKNFLFFLRT